MKDYCTYRIHSMQHIHTEPKHDNGDNPIRDEVDLHHYPQGETKSI